MPMYIGSFGQAIHYLDADSFSLPDDKVNAVDSSSEGPGAG
jgi:hypothetical protein